MKKIELLILDVDGTLTDGKIHISAEGELFKSFDIKDGYGIKNLLPQCGITPVVLTARESHIVQKRCEELGILHCYQGVEDKLCYVIETLLPKMNVSFDVIAYMGDDLVDLPCMERCAVKGCPADAVGEVKAICDFVSQHNGGSGAVREFIQWLLEREKK